MIIFAILAYPAFGEKQQVEQKPITVFRSPERYTTFPDVKKLPDGRLLCVFRDASFPEKIYHIEHDARIVGAISKDNGRHWSKPQVIYDDPHCQNDPSVAVLKDGRFLLTFFNWVGRSKEYVQHNESIFARQADHGEWGAVAEPGGVHLVWGKSGPTDWLNEARRIIGSHRLMAGTSASVLELNNGTLLLPFYIRKPDKKTYHSYVYHSTDKGRSWKKKVLIAADPRDNIYFCEPAVAQASNGDIIALMRTNHPKDYLYQARSTDNSITWSKPEQTLLIGHPPDFQLLPDGRLLAVYGYRHKPFGVRACISKDNGKTWDIDNEIIITDRGAHYDLGYPSVCLTDDQHLCVVYYMNMAGTTDRWIECKRIPLQNLP